MGLLENLALRFGVAASPRNLRYALAGCLLGTLVGVLPGVGPLAGISLLLPATFGMDTTAAIIMLAGIYYGSQYGGSTTSILMNIPGESSSVVTCLDGYRMAQQGRAGPALGIAAFGSCIAGTLSVAGLMLFAPLLARLALGFGPPEFFALMALGLVLLGYMGSGSMLKTLMMAVLGLILGAVGIDPITGTCGSPTGWWPWRRASASSRWPWGSSGWGRSSTAWTRRCCPPKPITLVNPFPPGGTLDLHARAVASRIEAHLGQPAPPGGACGKPLEDPGGVHRRGQAAALLGKNVEAYICFPGVCLPQVRAGKIRTLAVFGTRRLPGYPEVPTVKRLGYDAEYYAWMGIMAPKGTPPGVIAKLRGPRKAGPGPLLPGRDGAHRRDHGLPRRRGVRPGLGGRVPEMGEALETVFGHGPSYQEAHAWFGRHPEPPSHDWAVHRKVKTVEMMAQQLKQAGVDRAVLVNMVSCHFWAGSLPNDFIAKYCRQFPDLFIGFGGVDPHIDRRAAVREVERCREPTTSTRSAWSWTCASWCTPGPRG